MIHLFHGDQIEASRKELGILWEKFKGKEVVILNGKTLTVSDLIQATESASLFGSERLVIVENLLAKKLGGKVKAKDVNEWGAIIAKIPPPAEVVFWEEKEMGKSVLNLLPKNTDVALFRPDRNLFRLVESLRPGSGGQLLELFEKSVKIDATELVFSLIVRQFHYMIMIKEAGKQIADLAPWQIGKLARQTEWFTSTLLRKYYLELLDIDIKIKTSTTPFNLTQELKLFLIGI